ncbi:MAG: hypothetical protein IJ759_07015 [Bacteroidales bacterium]|nr:hypothetical protein [Bacteroidales bacterium]
MKKYILILFAVVLFGNVVKAQSWGYTNSQTTKVKGYYKSNGTYVQPHNRTKRNNISYDNYSTKGNSNFYTGKKGSRAKDYSLDAYNYGAGRQIKTGPRGGQYYNTNNKTKKTYVPKR